MQSWNASTIASTKELHKKYHIHFAISNRPKMINHIPIYIQILIVEAYKSYQKNTPSIYELASQILILSFVRSGMQKLFQAALLVLYHTGYAREYSYLLQHAFVTIFAQFLLSTDPVWKSLECDAARNKNLSFCYL